jgi:hypothetical protein
MLLHGTQRFKRPGAETAMGCISLLISVNGALRFRRPRTYRTRVPQPASRWRVRRSGKAFRNSRLRSDRNETEDSEIESTSSIECREKLE